MKSLVMPVVGLPNVGKSTIINALMGDKISIVTHKPHTTRSMIFGAKKTSDTEILFVDTPGIENVSTKLGSLIFKSMKQYLSSLDEMLLVLDATNPRLDQFDEVICKSVVVLNKIDRVRKPKLLPIIEQLQNLGAKEIFMVAANSGDGMNELSQYLSKRAEGAIEHKTGSLYVEDIAQFACECVREKILMHFEQEIPYKIWIYPKSVNVSENSSWKISLCIVVPKQSYKPILLGKGGQQIKTIGTAARVELCAKLKQPGYLDLEIVVDEKLWQKDLVYEQLGWKNRK